MKERNRNNAVTTTEAERTLFGYAYGDAWGRTTESLKHSQITDPPVLPTPAVVSDITQKSLQNLQALQTIFEQTQFSEEWQETLLSSESEQEKVRLVFAQAAEKFHSTQVRKFAFCAPWFGLVHKLSRESIAVLAILQSQVTQELAEVWVVEAASALLVKDLVGGRLFLYHKPEMEHDSEFVHLALEVLEELQTLNSMLNTAAFTDAARTIHDQLRNLLVKEWRTLTYSGVNRDVAQFLGEGWSAAEAFMVCVMVAASCNGDPNKGVKRLVWTSGNSGVMSALGGAFMFADNSCRPKEVNTMRDFMRDNLQENSAKELAEAQTLIPVFNS